MTFSIVAWDPAADPSPEWGVAVASKFLAVGAAVPWARAGVGALATQALANLAYGPGGLHLLNGGASADDVVQRLTSADDQRADRQLGVVDRNGNAATFTGADCFQWAGGRTGPGYCCQGNILTGPDVVDEMCDAFESSSGDLTARMLTALTAGDGAGGDRRGRQSASILVVREGGGYGGGIDTTVDLRVDDHPEPVAELTRLLEIHRLLFPAPGDLAFMAIDDELAGELRDLLRRSGHRVEPGTGYDEALKRALFEYVGTENLEERWSEGAEVDARVLTYLREQAS